MLGETIEEEPSVEDRLIKVKQAIQKATKDALKNSSNVNIENPNVSFQLGMELFGKEVSHVEKNVRERLAKIEDELQNVLEEADATGDSSSSEPATTNGMHQNKSPEEIRRETEQLRVKVRFLQECSSARSLLDESITLSSPSLAPNEEPNLPQAAKLQVNAQQALGRAQDIVKAEEEKDRESHTVLAANKILDPIRSSIHKQKVDLMGQAKKTWQTCVTLSSNSLSVRGQNDLVTAYDVLETFAENGSSALEDVLRRFTRDLHNDVFQPVLDRHLAGKQRALQWTFDESEEQSGSSTLVKHLGKSSKGSIRRLQWSSEDDEIGDTPEHAPSTPDLSGWKNTISFLQRIIAFTVDHVLLNRDSACRFVGKRLFGKPEASGGSLNLEIVGLENMRIGDDNGLLREPLLQTLETTCLPTYLTPENLGKLVEYAMELDSFLTPFLGELESKQLLSDGGGIRLLNFAASFEEKYVEKRRCTILNQARELLLNNDYHNTVEVGVDARPNEEDKRLGLDDGLSVFKLHKSSVSDTAFKLMKVCRQTMDEAVSQKVVPRDSPLALLPPTLYRTAREVLDLFRAIIPVTQGNEIASVPRTAAVLHNDCVFLAHNCLTLGLEFKEKFPSVDQDDVRGNLLRHACSFVDMVPLFRDLAERSMAKMLDLQAKEIMELVAERIVLFGDSLRSDDIVTEWSEAENAVNAGLYHLRHLVQAWRPVLSYDVLNRSMGYLADILFGLLLDQVSKASDISVNACQFVSTQFGKATKDVDELLQGDRAGSRLWDRFRAIGCFMDMSLADINVALADGVFRSVSSPELSKLVKACFDDSPKRKELLRLMSTFQ